MAPLVLYFDRNFGKRIPGALSKLRPPFEVRWHQGEGFPQNMPDDEWLEVVSKKNWIVFTQDIKFHIIEHEAEAIKQHAARCIYFPGANDGMWKKLCLFFRYHEKVMRAVEGEAPPYIFELSGSGRLEKRL